jgi:flavin reductase (DIM6/NTAB) family NADH-FMN oxidoreductase RutF
LHYLIDPNDPKAHGLPHNPLHGIVVPRPIGWVSTIDPQGSINLAPFSFFNAASERPPAVALSINGTHRRHGGSKDTLANIEATGQFVVNLANWGLREAMNQSSAPMPTGVDEMAACGLRPAPSLVVKPPRIAEAPAALECELFQIVRLPAYSEDNPNHTIFGMVRAVHIRDDIIVDGRVDIASYRPIARLGYHDYAVIDSFFSMPSLTSRLD